jgi:glycosyltransferase involved in cell wall biosynthesis
LIDIFLVRLKGTRLIWTVHNQIEHETIFPYLEHWLRQILINLADHIIIHNYSTLESLSQEYNFSKEKVTVIAHGHYRTTYLPSIALCEARECLTLPGNRQLYLHLGSLRPYKGIEHLLEIWQANQTSLSESILLIAGCTYDQGYTDKLYTLVKQLNNVILHPQFIEAERIHLYLSAADVVILPYTRILTSGSVILAMSYGKPVIAPRLGAIPETLGAADWLLYDPNDPQGLSHAIQKSLTCSLEDLSRLTVQSCDLLDWEPIGLQTAHCYRHSLSKPSNPSQNRQSR